MWNTSNSPFSEPLLLSHSEYATDDEEFRSVASHENSLEGYEDVIGNVEEEEEPTPARRRVEHLLLPSIADRPERTNLIRYWLEEYLGTNTWLDRREDSIQQQHPSDATTTTTTTTERNMNDVVLAQLPAVTDSLFVFNFSCFLSFTIITILLFHLLIKHVLVWEHRQSLIIPDLLAFDGPSIVQDSLVFFLVGRLYQIKRVALLLEMASIAILSALYTSWIPQFSFLQHSVTLYEMHCTWPWQLWVYVFVLIVPLCVGVLYWHVQYARKHTAGTLTGKAIEVIGLTSLFLLPLCFNVNATASSFEFHHWFAGWLFGMHANIGHDAVWPLSRWTMAWCWGLYINGLAVWGRDPLLTCAYANHVLHRQGCRFELEQAESHEGNTFLAPFLQHLLGGSNGDGTDWRHCSR